MDTHDDENGTDSTDAGQDAPQAGTLRRGLASRRRCWLGEQAPQLRLGPRPSSRHRPKPRSPQLDITGTRPGSRWPVMCT
jgi:hypothetical protein